jgi:hypothetical protein
MVERRFIVNKRILLGAVLFLIFVALAAGPILAQTGVTPAEDDLPGDARICSPYVERTVERTDTNRDFAEGLFWGDTHLHTRYSTDAGMVGCKLGPEDAYRFAMGEEVISRRGSAQG